jgi:hypothetical protein
VCVLDSIMLFAKCFSAARCSTKTTDAVMDDDTVPVVAVVMQHTLLSQT